MIFENPRLPEGINSGRRQPLRDLLILGGGVAGVLAGLVALFLLAAHFLGPFVPFSWEAVLAGGGDTFDADAPPQAAALRALGDRVAAAMDLPEGMTVKVHLLDLDTPNAFATLGGHVIVTSAMIRALPNENALAWVLAHEIAHVRHRDPIRGASSGLLLGLLGAFVTGESAIGDLVVGGGGMVGSLGFSRRREEEADAAGLPALLALYGHAGGYGEALEALQAVADTAGGEPPVILASHPHLEDRRALLDALVAERGWPVREERTALPPALQ